MDSIALSQLQIAHHQIIERLIRRVITEKDAAALVEKSVRQVRRMKQHVLASGVSGLIHGNTGKHPWNKQRQRFVDPHRYVVYHKICRIQLSPFDAGKKEGIIVKREWLREVFLVPHHPPGRNVEPRGALSIENVNLNPGSLISAGYIYPLTGLEPVSRVHWSHPLTMQRTKSYYFPSDGTIPNMAAMKRTVETHDAPVAFMWIAHRIFITTRHESVHVQLTGRYDETQIARALKEDGTTPHSCPVSAGKGRSRTAV